VLVSAKEKRQRREIATATMSDRETWMSLLGTSHLEPKLEERLGIDQACALSGALLLEIGI
jgi:hypothetical protein